MAAKKIAADDPTTVGVSSRIPHCMSRIPITDLNPHLTCALCTGYFVDATTVVECLHSFCRACLLSYLETSDTCPICDIQINENQLHKSIRSDHTLQDLVYKLIPGLYKTELQRRKEFCSDQCKNASSEPCTSTGPSTDKLFEIFDKRLVDLASSVCAPDEIVSFSLEFYRPPPPQPLPAKRGRRQTRKRDSHTTTSELTPALKDLSYKRYFRCPAAVKMTHLKKLLSHKLDLTNCHQVDIWHLSTDSIGDEILPEDLSLRDVAFIYSWNRVEDELLSTSVLSTEKYIRLKMLQTELNAIKLKREMEQMLSKNAVNMKRLNEILETLRTMEMDLDVLRKTKIGVCVNNVRKTFKNSKEIAKSTAELIRKWKKIAKEEFRGKSESEASVTAVATSSSPPAPVGDVITVDDSLNENNEFQNDHSYFTLNRSTPDSSNSRSSGSTTNQHRKAAVAEASRDKRKQRFVVADDDDDESDTYRRESFDHDSEDVDDQEADEDSSNMPKNEFRRKSIELLTDALLTESSPANNGNGGNHDDMQRIAADIEKFIFHEHPDANDKKYKAKVRSRVMNLRDKNNPEFRRNVIRGHVTPEQAASMSVEDMASAQLKNLRKSIEEETMRERELKDSTSALGKSTMFCCPQCDGRDTSYTISQDRLEGEYEPVAVTSIVCNKCGHRWKSF